MAADAGVTAISKDDDVLNEARVWRDAGRDVAIATVIRTWGSAPRPVGSHLAIASGPILSPTRPAL